MLKRYKVDLSALSDHKVKITYTFKNHVQFYEIMTRDEAIDSRRLYFKGSEYKLSNKVDKPVKGLLRYGYFLYKLFGKDIAEERLSDFVNLNII